MIRRVLFALCLLAGLTTHRARAQRFLAMGVRDADVFTYMQQLQKAVAAGDRSAVAAMVNYPLRVNQGRAHRTLIANSAELVRRYDAVFVPDVRRAIVSQKLSDLIGTAQGVAIGRGIVWLSGACSREQPPVCRPGITSVNLPPPH